MAMARTAFAFSAFSLSFFSSIQGRTTPSSTATSCRLMRLCWCIAGCKTCPPMLAVGFKDSNAVVTRDSHASGTVKCSLCALSRIASKSTLIVPLVEVESAENEYSSGKSRPKTSRAHANVFVPVMLFPLMRNATTYSMERRPYSKEGLLVDSPHFSFWCALVKSPQSAAHFVSDRVSKTLAIFGMWPKRLHARSSMCIDSAASRTLLSSQSAPISSVESAINSSMVTAASHVSGTSR
mmetsp:Transcript_29176/g.87508  ORF Transcript_29176/g.87508 Transcript_29176/m.87508 type:complete len:238 (+) Transcript_29176:551-1264(+)